MPPTADESARAFRERAERARAERERWASETRSQVELHVRAHLSPGARAWLIGSLAWGGFGERSDVDLVLSGVDAAAETQIEDAIARVAGVEVDLLHLDDLTESFRQRVEQEGLPLHGL